MPLLRRMSDYEIYLKKLVLTGFGVPDGLTATRTIDLLKVYPSHVQELPPSKISNLDKGLRCLVINPTDLAFRAYDVLCGKNSVHREVLRNYKGGPVRAKVAGTFAALPTWGATSTIIDEIVEHCSYYNQRLLLMAGGSKFLTKEEECSISRKKFKRAVTQFVDIMEAKHARDCRIASWKPRVCDDRVRTLITYGDHTEHGTQQGNCVGDDKRLLREIAQGDKIIVEVTLDKSTYTVEVLLKPIKSIGKIEVGDGMTFAHKPARIVSLVKEALAIADDTGRLNETIRVR